MAKKNLLRRFVARPPTHFRSRLIAAHFLPWEADELGKLRGMSPALVMMLGDREDRWNKFEKLAAWKISHGFWERSEVKWKWEKNVRRLYTAMRWRVQMGPAGRQYKMGRRQPNPWAMYRWYENRAGGPSGKGYTSPWELKVLPSTAPSLDRQLIAEQRAMRQRRLGKTANEGQIRQWIAEKNLAIAEAKGERKKALILQRNNLERSLQSRRN